MRWIKTNIEFKRCINESINLWHDALLDSVKAEEVDIFKTFSLPKEEYQSKLDMELLSKDIFFINSLISLGLRLSNISNSDDFETFLNKPCRFAFVYVIGSSELENPIYILFQNWNQTLKKWEESKLYKVNDEIKKFYDKISSRTIKLEYNGKKYTYFSSNSNEWNLKSGSKTKDFKSYMRTEELEDLVQNKKLKINIV